MSRLWLLNDLVLVTLVPSSSSLHPIWQAFEPGEEDHSYASNPNQLRTKDHVSSVMCLCTTTLDGVQPFLRLPVISDECDPATACHRRQCVRVFVCVCAFVDAVPVTAPTQGYEE